MIHSIISKHKRAIRGIALKKIQNLVSCKEFLGLLFSLFLILFNWPLFSLSYHNPGSVFTFIFTIWVIIVVVLFIIGQALPTSLTDEEKENTPKGGADV